LNDFVFFFFDGCIGCFGSIATAEVEQEQKQKYSKQESMRRRFHETALLWIA
jgi:hypothetical protein